MCNTRMRAKIETGSISTSLSFIMRLTRINVIISQLKLFQRFCFEYFFFVYLICRSITFNRKTDANWIFLLSATHFVIGDFHFGID